MEVGALLIRDAVACGPDRTAREVAQTMIAEGVGSVAVVEDGQLIGLVTERDVTKMVAAGNPPETRVAEIMTSEPDSCDAEVEVEEVAEWLLAAGYRHMPITRDGEFVGVVSIKDVLLATESPGLAGGD